MKKCKNCNKNILNDAIFCPYCEEKIKEGNKTKEQKKKERNSWIIGWILIFPIPLTILTLRSQKIKKNFKIPIIVAAWMIYFLIAFVGGNDENNIKNLQLNLDSEIVLKVGQKESYRYVRVKVKSEDNFKPEDVIFVSENPEVATIVFSEQKLTTMLYFEIVGVNAGETFVYAMSADGSIKSETIHIIVPEPIWIEKIELGEVKTNMVLGESQKIETEISPSNADNKELIWSSSDVTVANVDDKGKIIAVGGGTATIRVASLNGIDVAFDIRVDGTKKLMKVNISHKRNDNNNIGNEWEFDYKINGENVTNQIAVGIGDVITVFAKITEMDVKPDVGVGSVSHRVSEGDFDNGFKVSFDVYVTENAGKNKGKTAHFIVTYTFSPY